MSHCDTQGYENGSKSSGGESCEQGDSGERRAPKGRRRKARGASPGKERCPGRALNGRSLWSGQSSQRRPLQGLFQNRRETQGSRPELSCFAPSGLVRLCHLFFHQGIVVPEAN